MGNVNLVMRWEWGNPQEVFILKWKIGIKKILNPKIKGKVR